MRIVFMGTPEIAVPTLAGLIEAGQDICAVYAQPPRASGRGMSERKGPVHTYADSQGLEVRTPVSLKGNEEQRAFADLHADAAVVIAYGLLLPKAILDAPRHGCFNMHVSALPRWRGAAPIQRAIMAGDTETAATAMRMEPGLDTGPICRQERIAIGADMTAGELHDVMKDTGARVMVDAMAMLHAGTLTQTPQAEDGVTYAAKIDKAEARLVFDRPATEVHNHIRGLSPFPGAWCEAEGPSGKRERIKVLRSSVIETQSEPSEVAPPGTTRDDELTIQCNPGAVRLTELQRAGKKPCAAKDLLCGFPLPKGRALA